MEVDHHYLCWNCGLTPPNTQELPNANGCCQECNLKAPMQMPIGKLPAYKLYRLIVAAVRDGASEAV